jgi:N-acetylneuraminate lyase
VNHPKIQGLVAAVPTPLRADGGINLDAVGRQAELLARNGVIGAFVGGTTGEGMSMTSDERMALANRWTEVAGKDMLVIVHVGHTALAESKALTAHAARIGAAAVGMMAPCFFRPRTVAELVDCCAAVAAAAPLLPFYYYHIPSLTGCPFLMLDFLKAAGDRRIPNLAGMKYTWEDLMDYRLCLEFDGGRYDMLFGRDEILLLGLACGAVGGIGSTYNCCAPVYTRLIEAFRAGDMPAAEAMQDRSVRYVQAIRRRAGRELSAVKTTMKFLGVDLGPARAPVPNLTADEERAFRQELEDIGFFEWGNR